MSGRMLVTFAALVFWLIPAVAPAATAPLFPLQLGAYSQFDGSDLSGHTWQASIWVVAQNIEFKSQTYFHIRRQNWNPYGWEPLGSQDFLMRSTEVAGYLSVGGEEWHQFQTTGTPQNWIYYDPPDQTQCYTQVEVTGPMEITVPYGYFPQAYQDKGTFTDPVHQYNPWYAYLAPGLGLIKEVQTNVPSESTTQTQVLTQTGTMGVSLFPMMTGYTWTYNARDKLGNKWQMTMRMQEQVTFGGHTYFRVRQNNYYGPGQNQEFYLRCSANQAWISYDGVTEYLAFQVARQGTQWTYPDPRYPGTDYIFLDYVGPINVLGGSFLAYPHDGTFVGKGGENGFWIDYIVPAVGLARRDDYNLPDPDRAPLIFELVKMEQVGSANPGVPGVLLLLLE